LKLLVPAGLSSGCCDGYGRRCLVVYGTILLLAILGEIVGVSLSLLLFKQVFIK